MLKKILFFAIVMGAYSSLSVGQASAQTCTGSGGDFTCESTTSGSTAFGFDPSVNLIPAVTATSTDSGPCFTCPNSNADGTTAGALTNSMFGEIRDNNHADLGDKSFSPGSQDMKIPGSADCGSSCNDSGSFTFSTPLSTQDFLSAGTSAGTTNPTMASVGKAGVKIEFSNNFSYNASDGKSTFTQSVTQTTFIEGPDGNELQVVTISSEALDNPANPEKNPTGGIINWTQDIQQGGFSLGPASGSFLYNNSSFDSASAPTGEGQTNGDTTDIP